MEVKIGIKELKIEAFIGVYPEERKAKQDLIIDLEVTPTTNVLKDDISSTINYEKIVEICKKAASEKTYFLIESLAEDILDRCLDSLPISQAFICLSKPRAFKDASAAYVKMTKGKK